MADESPDVDVAATASSLLAARARRGSHPSLLASQPGFSVADGYAVAAAIHIERCAGGERRVGRKIGLTQPAAWPALDAGAPIWGSVYDTTLQMASHGTARLEIGSARSPRIEPEIGFCLRRPIDPDQVDFDSLVDAIDWIAPCFEVIDSHFEGWKFKAAEAIADFGVHFALIVGEPLRLDSDRRATLAEQLARCDIELRCGDRTAERGVGANTLGSPLAALAALARVLAEHPGQPALAAGEIITTGTLTPARGIALGERWEMRVEGLALSPLQLEIA